MSTTQKLPRRRRKSRPAKRSKRLGSQLERYVASVLGGALTKNSGATGADGDIRLGQFSIECKWTSKMGRFYLKQDDYEKHNRGCEMRGFTPVWVLQHANGPIVCMINLADFAQILLDLEPSEPTEGLILPPEIGKKRSDQ